MCLGMRVCDPKSIHEGAVHFLTALSMKRAENHKDYERWPCETIWMQGTSDPAASHRTREKKGKSSRKDNGKEEAKGT